MAKSSERAVESQSVPRGAVSVTIELDEQPSAVPTREQIEQRAYAIYLERGCADGLDVQDWLQAERELLAAAENSSQARVAAA